MEIGEETLDLTSTVDFVPASVKSLPADSCFDVSKGILIIPYNTSAISISISSCTATGDDNLHDDDDFGGNGFCFVPDGCKIYFQSKEKWRFGEEDLSEIF